VQEHPRQHRPHPLRVREAQQASAERRVAKDIGAKRFEAEALILHGLALRGLVRREARRSRGADLSREVCPT
jgi:hypothetical protein